MIIPSFLKARALDWRYRARSRDYLSMRLLTPVVIAALAAKLEGVVAMVVYRGSHCLAWSSSSEGDKRSQASAPPAARAPSIPTTTTW